MATYEDIRKANEAVGISTIKKEGKNGKITTFGYVTVAQRIKAFRMVHPDGLIKTEMVMNESGVCIFRAEIYSEDGKLLSTGTALERQDSGFINALSHIENCETSACGRALGIAGYGIDDDVASAEEVANATIQQAQMKNPPDTHVRALESRCKHDGMPVEKLCESYKVKSLSDLTMEQYNHIHKNWSILLKMAKEEK